jgi:hypothetical protein
MNVLLVFAIIFAGAVGPNVPTEPQGISGSPFEGSTPATPQNKIDELVLAWFKRSGIQPANICSDGVFVRRVYLDVIGTLPTPKEADEFLQDQNPNKRISLINRLLEREEFVDYWTLKWCDLLRVKSEFPINLWPNAVQAYYRWIHDSLRMNMPYDQFARELLTSSGSNFRVPQVNFYRAIQGRNLSDIARTVALTFMGTRYESLPQSTRTNMEVFFSQVAYKKTAEWKEEIIYLNPAPARPREAVFPDGRKVQIQPEDDPRRVFADWLTEPNNQWFARNITNRVWAWLMGRGIINEPDDIRPDNPPVNPELLAFLEKELVRSKYNLKTIYRLILNSGIYQQSSIPRSNNPQAEAMFACYPVRRLDAEVLIDALDQIGGTGENYSSNIPEPFTFIPEGQRTIKLEDGSITSPFLEMFGRPARDTGLESERNNQPSDSQRLYLLNSNDIKNKIERSAILRQQAEAAKGNRTELIKNIYLTIVSRYPTKSESDTAEKYFQSEGMTRKTAIEDLAWALINTKEFLYRH